MEASNDKVITVTIDQGKEDGPAAVYQDLDGGPQSATDLLAAEGHPASVLDLPFNRACRQAMAGSFQLHREYE